MAAAKDRLLLPSEVILDKIGAIALNASNPDTSNGARNVFAQRRVGMCCQPYRPFLGPKTAILTQTSFQINALIYMRLHLVCV